MESTGSVSLYVMTGLALFFGIVAAVLYRSSRADRTRIRGLVDITAALLNPAVKDRASHDAGDEIGNLESSLRALAREIAGVIEKLNVEALRREAILSSMTEGVVAVDKELRVIFCNEAIIEATGVRQPLSGRFTLLELVRDFEVLTLVRTAVEGGTQSKRRLTLAAAGGRLFEVYAAPFTSLSEGGAIAIFHDVTELEHLEQVRKDFVANVSHEIRTPLASIIGYSDTLLDGALEAAGRNRKFVEVIRSNAVRLNAMAADLLILSEIEAGVNPGQAERVAVRGVIESALRTVEPEARSGGVNITTGILQDVSVFGHRLRLEQAVLNLVANAVKFNRPGGEVRISVIAGETGHAQIEIADTGIGIPSQDLPRIFERFYRVDMDRSRATGGTGLGLSIVKHIVEGMDGRVKVESELGKGSIFTITLAAAHALSAEWSEARQQA